MLPADITALRARLDRSHQMACSDPSDPSRVTQYSEARDAIDTLLTRLVAAEALVSQWRATIPHRSGAFYPEATAYDSGIDSGYEACADDLEAILKGTTR